MNFLKTKFNSNLVASANTTLNAPPKSYAWLIYVFLLILLVFGVYYGSRYLYEKLKRLNEINIGKYFKKDEIQGETKDESENVIGNYCYVGEDLTGRFCVKVPEAELCPKSRAFRTRGECEMVKASPMPLTIQENHGTKAIPLSGLPTV